ncbi:2-amino-4-hydroxy-6-hydroxymethyldihydropteridine diphosphokinase [Bradyrhizobium sp. LHD-71]|uniref:2-amino-4-hydroxy-6- hydroxymethyldihydropteridine diphosphokinase n=1 Tax=Bradyrhizobium sp. LHD-71 TaxID=3072141 RepID=UPI00280D4767|nr:2-amino-4-hydroxy-6-hydroxymethyldihydropteridine diphosphokinase [Bradyrhizobium sp. LHD-71]MDQ8728548.1 2-amino-4-hydroxy-6-hydroxymethyldihydropteridine diphosphokinase [Bradyrhizobium sp. LHD-71]
MVQEFQIGSTGAGPRVTSALIALGGNVGDVRARFARAIPAICDRARARLVARSSDYSTPPWGEEQQPSFVNACIEIETPLDPHALLQTLHDIEREHGRDRRNERRWGPRTLDLDLLAFDDLAIDEHGLTLPHPRLFERAFVLVPLSEIAPNRTIGGRTAAAALRTVAADGVEKLPPA